VVAGGSTTGTQLTFGTVTRNNQGTVLFRGGSLGAAAGPGVAAIRSTTTGFSFIGASGGPGTTNKGIIPWALVDTSATGAGISFATVDSGTAALRPLTASEYIFNALTAGNNVQLNSGTSLTTPSVNLNSLTLADSAALNLAPGQTLTLASGGLLALGDYTGTGISGGLLTSGVSELIVQAVGDLNLDATLLGASLTKSGPGTLTLSRPVYTGQPPDPHRWQPRPQRDGSLGQLPRTGQRQLHLRRRVGVRRRQQCHRAGGEHCELIFRGTVRFRGAFGFR
jgi:hypothetical protein